MITFRAPLDEKEEEWLEDDYRWMNQKDFPEDYLGSCYERSLIAEVDGIKCVVKIMAPNTGLCKVIEKELMDGEEIPR